MQMPMFRFHLREGARFTPDWEGQECSGLAGANERAVQSARSVMAAALIESGDFSLDGAVLVIDESCAVVAEIDFQDAAHIHLPLRAANDADGAPPGWTRIANGSGDPKPEAAPEGRIVPAATPAHASIAAAPFRFHLYEQGLEVGELGSRDLVDMREALDVGLKLAAVGIDQRADLTSADIRISRADMLLAIVEFAPALRVIDPSLGGEQRALFERLVRSAEETALKAHSAVRKTRTLRNDSRILIDRSEKLIRRSRDLRNRTHH